MERILTPQQMARADKTAQELYCLPSLVLMERAALAAYAILKNKEKWGFDLSRPLIIAGTGNNGGDALAVARLLYEDGYVPRVIICGNEDKATASFINQKKSLMAYGIDAKPYSLETVKGEYSVIVDGIFGISLKREVEGIYAECINYINSYRGSHENTRVLALDMPSGIHAGNGRIYGTAVRADVTASFGFKKVGQLLYPGAEYCGELLLCKIGIPEEAVDRNNKVADAQKVFSLTEDEIRLPDRPAYSNKGTFGKVLLIAGSEEMCGAAVLSGLAAMRAGAGMLKIVTHERNRETIMRLFPEAMLLTYMGELLPVKELLSSIDWCDCIAIGPGLGKSAMARSLVETVIAQDKASLVIDADALNIIADNTELLSAHQSQVVITPHVGEMSRLAGIGAAEIASHLLETAQDFAKTYDVTVVLKDARTVIADSSGKCYINVNGNSGMATAGSGDVLTGIIAALIAGRMKPLRAAVLGAALHGKAGDAGAVDRSESELLARDIIKYLN